MTQCINSTVGNTSVCQVDADSSPHLHFVYYWHKIKENIATWWTTVMLENTLLRQK